MSGYGGEPSAPMTASTSSRSVGAGITNLSPPTYARDLDVTQVTLDRTKDNKFDSESRQGGWGRLVFTPPDAHPNYDLVDNVCNFGRRNGCNILLNHPAISGVHCKL